MKTRVLYLAGLGRSGSTLLTRLLGEVDGVCAVGELHHLWKTGAVRAADDELCGCGRTYADCGFWRSVLDAAFDGQPIPIEEMRKLQAKVARIRHVRKLEGGGNADFEAAVEAYGAFWHRLYREISLRTGSEVVLDASKDLGPLFFLKRVPQLEVAVVHLVRDPRGAAHSWSKRKLRPEFVGREVYMNRHGPVAASWRWTYSNLLAERVQRHFPRFLRLRYEDFIAEPKASLARILRLAGLERSGREGSGREGSALEGGGLDFLDGHTARLGSPDCLVSGNPMRFDDGELELRPDTAWESSMPALHRAVVGGLTWSLRRRYGYSG